MFYQRMIGLNMLSHQTTAFNIGLGKLAKKQRTCDRKQTKVI